RRETNSAGIRFDLSSDPYILLPDGQKINGSFDDDVGALGVTTGGKSLDVWLSLLAHEFSHFDQWREKADVWTNMRVNGRDASELVFEWIQGRNFKKEF